LCQFRLRFLEQKLKPFIIKLEISTLLNSKPPIIQDAEPVEYSSHPLTRFSKTHINIRPILKSLPWFPIIQFFIINVPNQQLQGQLQTQHNVDIGNSIKDKHTIKTTATE
jgi:hypothetical protein